MSFDTSWSGAPTPSSPEPESEEPKICSSTPDTSGVNAAAQQSSQTAQQALDWYTQEAARTQGQRDQSAATQNDIAQQQLAAMGQQNALAQDYADYNKTTFRPLEESIVSSAQNYDTPERQAAAADAARADVRAAQAGQQTTAAQSLARMGYDPTVDATKLAANNALAEAGASTAARRNVEATGHAMEMDAASLGRNLPSAQATAIQTGTQAGQGASGAATGAVNTSMGGAALMGQGYGTAIQGYGTAGNLYGQAAQLGQTDNSGLWGAVGSLGGAAMSHYSSKKLKDSGAAMPDEVALDAVKGAEVGGAPAEVLPAATGASRGKHTVALARMANDTWKYHDGVEDGAVHVGPYAEEAHAVMGNKVAPRGKQINMKESADFNGKAIAELSARVEKLTHALGAHR